MSAHRDSPDDIHSAVENGNTVSAYFTNEFMAHFEKYRQERLRQKTSTSIPQNKNVKQRSAKCATENASASSRRCQPQISNNVQRSKSQVINKPATVSTRSMKTGKAEGSAKKAGLKKGASNIKQKSLSQQGSRREELEAWKKKKEDVERKSPKKTCKVLVPSLSNAKTRELSNAAYAVTAAHPMWSIRLEVAKEAGRLSQPHALLPPARKLTSGSFSKQSFTQGAGTNTFEHQKHVMETQSQFKKSSVTERRKSYCAGLQARPSLRNTRISVYDEPKSFSGTKSEGKKTTSRSGIAVDSGYRQKPKINDLTIKNKTFDRRKSCSSHLSNKDKTSTFDRRKSYSMAIQSGQNKKSPIRTLKISVGTSHDIPQVVSKKELSKNNESKCKKVVYMPARIDTGLTKKKEIIQKPRISKKIVVRSPPKENFHPRLSTKTATLRNQRRSISQFGVQKKNSHPSLPVETRTRRSILKTPAKINDNISAKKKRRSVRFISSETESPCQSFPMTPASRRVTQRHSPLQCSPLGLRQQDCTPCSPLPATPSSNSSITKGKRCTRKSAEKTPSALRRRLDDWLETKGKSPNRYRHSCCFGQKDEEKDPSNKVSKTRPGGLSSEQLEKQQSLLTSEEAAEELEDLVIEDPEGDLHTIGAPVLAAFVRDLDKGDSEDTVRKALETVCLNFNKNQLEKLSSYWVCKARLAEAAGDAQEALSLYEHAVRKHTQPAEVLAVALQEFVVRQQMVSNATQEIEEDYELPYCDSPIVSKRIKKRMDQANVFESSTIKYCFTNTTPFFSRLNQQIHDDGDVAHSVVTPVRRSTRLSKRSLPSILQEHDTLVESLTELPSSTQKNLLFTPNSHLRHNVNEVSKKLDDDIMEKV